MRTVFLLVAVLPGLALAAPAPPQNAKRKQSKPHPAEVVCEGKILVVRGLEGGEPQLTAEDGQRWLLIGLLKEELLRLDGHKLKAWGVEREKKLMMPTVEVNRYDILDAGGGRRPAVGMLRRAADGAGLQLERKEGGALDVKGSRPMLQAMERRLRCKVWVVGDLEGQAVKVVRFGWLSCKPPKDLKTEKSGKETKK